MQVSYSLQLTKESFHFSASHFTIFSGESRELLHGHNYYLSVTLFGERLEHGFLVDIERLKPLVRNLCQKLDHQMLVPEKSPHLTIHEDSGQVLVRYGHSEFRMPVGDVTRLPVDNITMENLAHHFAQLIWHSMDHPGLTALEVALEESRGQRAAVRISAD